MQEIIIEIQKTLPKGDARQVYIRYDYDGIDALYGYLDTDGLFAILDSEMFLFSEHPELRDIRTGGAWDIFELAAFIEALEDEDEDEDEDEVAARLPLHWEWGIYGDTDKKYLRGLS